MAREEPPGERRSKHAGVRPPPTNYCPTRTPWLFVRPLVKERSMITPLTVDKRKALDLVTAQIDKQFGTGAIMRFGDGMPGLAIETIPTGSIALDLALGVGGIPRGRVIEVYGPESSGKTTLCQHILAEAQKLGGTVAYIDVEHALDVQYAQACGLSIEEMLISQPDTGEQALQIVDERNVRQPGDD